jgi:hypothetical protein
LWDTTVGISFLGLDFVSSGNSLVSGSIILVARKTMSFLDESDFDVTNTASDFGNTNRSVGGFTMSAGRYNNASNGSSC